MAPVTADEPNPNRLAIELIVDAVIPAPSINDAKVCKVEGLPLVPACACPWTGYV